MAALGAEWVSVSPCLRMTWNRALCWWSVDMEYEYKMVYHLQFGACYWSITELPLTDVTYKVPGSSGEEMYSGGPVPSPHLGLRGGILRATWRGYVRNRYPLAAEQEQWHGALAFSALLFSCIDFCNTLYLLPSANNESSDPLDGFLARFSILHWSKWTSSFTYMTPKDYATHTLFSVTDTENCLKLVKVVPVIAKQGSQGLS
jgi:hypothetical protein